VNADLERLRAQFRSFASTLEQPGRSPLYAEICRAVAHDD